MSESNWVYQFVIPFLLLITWALFFCVSFFAYVLGVKAQKKKLLNLTDIVPANILGLLALILSFTFSMAISRYDLRRELVIKEANAIDTAYLKSHLLRKIPEYDVQSIYRGYLESRIAFYEGTDYDEAINSAARFKKKIWNHLIEITQKDRSDIEAEYADAVNEMFDAANSRNFAILVKLPISIYFMILFIACIALGIINFDRGYKNENAHWRPAILIILLGFIMAIIFDIDHPRIGTIEVSQQAIVDLRNSI